MGKCRYCGKPAGFLRKQHDACRKRYEAAWAEMVREARDQAVSEEPPSATLVPQLTARAEGSFMGEPQVRAALVEGWKEAAERFLDDHLLSADEDRRLAAYVKAYDLPPDRLAETGIPGQLRRAAVLREVTAGKVPDGAPSPAGLPFNFQKTEKLIWVFAGVRYYEDRTRRHYEGGHAGASFRVAKGFYLRTGAFRGYPVDTTETVDLGRGTLAVTNRHLYFYSEKKTFRVRFDRIVAIVPYSNGFGIVKDTKAAKPRKFVTGDGWFAYNLVVNAQHVE